MALSSTFLRTCNSSHLLSRQIRATTTSLSFRLYSHEPEIRPPGKVKVKALTSYVKYLNKISGHFEKRYPKTYDLVRRLKDGISGFYIDTKAFYRITMDIYNGKHLNKFSRADLSVYAQIPSDTRRALPVLVIAPIPFTFYFIVPLLYFFPRQLLSRHFWTPEQKLGFGLYYLKHRLPHYSKVLHYLYHHSKEIKDSELRDHLKESLKKIRTGGHLSVEEVVKMSPLFKNKPFGLDHLSRVHRIHWWHIAKSMDMSTWKRFLWKKATLLYHIDLAIVREGTASMNLEELQQACFARGLNPIGLEKQQLVNYLKTWTEVSKNLDDENLSLLLHCPAFLAYNMPSNKKYMKTSSKKS